MPIYTFDCPHCGLEVDAFLKMDDRNSVFRCSRCGGWMARRFVYLFGTAPNEASNWPYDSDALLPRDGSLLRRYAKDGRLTKDASGGTRVRIESPADYRKVCREQGVEPQGDYEKFSRSVARPRKKSHSAAKERMRKETRAALKAKGIL